jgi:Family of unknown function (DUF6328)
MSTPKIEDRLKDLLDETRLAMLGTQLLLGLQYQAAFSNAFDDLPAPFAALDSVALLLILAAAALLLAIPSLHHITESGHATGYIIAHASFYLKAALLPLAGTLGIDIGIGLVGTAGAAVAFAGGLTFTLAAIGTWYVLPLSAAEQCPEDTMEDKQQSLEARVVQALTELRVVLPGAQALFGFLFIAVLTQAFDRLPAASKGAHLASLGAVAIAVILLIAPAAYHRIAAKGRAEERVLKYTTRMMMCALGLLALGLVGGAYVTVRKITEMPQLALSIAVVALIGFAAMLYLIPLYTRVQRHRDYEKLQLHKGAPSYFPAQKSSVGSSRRLARKWEKLHRRTGIG